VLQLLKRYKKIKLDDYKRSSSFELVNSDNERPSPWKHFYQLTFCFYARCIVIFGILEMKLHAESQNVGLYDLFFSW
jgi:hypothetical protein